MTQKLLLLLVSVIFATDMLLAQADKGWELILENDYQGARKSFVQVLDQDSSDQSALLGLMYLSDISRDSRNMEKLSRKLLLSSGQEFYFSAFQDTELSEEDWQSIIADERLSERVRFPFRHRLLRKKSGSIKTFAEYRDKMEEFFLPADWAFIGPFKNIGGSGFEVAHGPEQNPRRVLPQSYDNGLGKPLRWIRPQPQDPHGFLSPGSDYLPENSSCNLYYLHKEFGLDADTSLYLSFGRTLPLVIWLDGEEVFQDAGNRHFHYDDERIKLQLTAGKHDLRIKLVPYNPNTRPYPEFIFLEVDVSQDTYSRSAGICPRLTDQRGVQARLSEVKGLAPGKLISAERLQDEALVHYRSKIRSESFQWSDYYVMARLLMQKGLYQEGVDFFAQEVARRPGSVYLRSFLAMFHGSMGHFVQAYRSLEKLDLFATPFYPLIFKEMQRINPQIRGEEYQRWLSLMQEVAPSNRAVVRQTVEFFRLKNWSDTLETFKKQTLDAYPEYEILFKDDYSYRNRDQEDEKFSFTTWRAKQKGKREDKKTKKDPLAGLDEDLARYPYRKQLYQDKANYLIEKERWSEALVALNQGLLVAPADYSMLELKGDIFLKQQAKDSARVCYELANDNRHSQGYWRDDLNQKLNSLRTGSDAKEAFEEVSFDDILDQADQWQKRYQDEHAVVPLRTIQYFVDTNGNIEGQQKMLVQINTLNGVRAWTQENFSYLGQNVAVKVVRPDGSEFRPEQNGNFAVFKDLRPGDRIFAEGTENQSFDWRDHPFNDHWMIWQNFMLPFPVYHTYLEVAVPQGEGLPYVPYQLDLEPTIRTEAGYDFYRWELNELGKIKDEEAGLGQWYSTPSLWLSNITDWSKYVAWYDDLTYRKLQPNADLQNTYDELVQPGMTDEEKVIAFYTYITQDINYSSVSFLQSNFEPQAPELTCSSGIGDCKDVATLMIALLRMAGIESYYSLTLANQYLPFECLPQMIFNHVVVAYVIDGKMRFIDLTTDRFPWYALPDMDAQAWSLLIKPGENRIFRLPDHRTDSTTNLVDYEMMAQIHTDGRIDMQLQGRYQGVQGAIFREYLNDGDRQDRDDYLRSQLKVGAFSRQSFGEIALEKLEQIHEELLLQTTIQAEDFAEDLYGLTIFQLPLVGESNLPDALLQEDRFGLLDLEQILSLAPNRQQIDLQFPEGLKLFQLPENVQFETPFGEYELGFEATEQGLRIRRYLRFSQAMIQPEDFGAFKEFFYRTNKHDRTKLVLVEEGLKLRD